MLINHLVGKMIVVTNTDKSLEINVIWLWTGFVDRNTPNKVERRIHFISETDRIVTLELSLFCFFCRCSVAPLWSSVDTAIRLADIQFVPQLS